MKGLDENTLNLNIYNGSAWNTYTPTTRDAVNNYITATALSSIAITQATLSGSFPLPVTLTRFGGEENNCIALLKWSTAAEQNSREFQVQQGSASFSTTGVVPAAGNSSIVKNYQLSLPLFYPLNYFRLRMVDNDGNSKYSGIVKISSTCATNIVTVVPNPTSQTILIRGLSGSNRLILLNPAGQQIASLSTANTTAEFDLSKLPSGNYVVQVINEGKTMESFKVIKN